MARLGRQHIAHAIRRCPHPLADLALARQARGQAYIDVAILIGLDPRRRLHCFFADHRTGFHHGVDLVTRAIQEAGVDKDHAVACRRDTVAEVHAGAAFLIHNAHFQRQRRQAQPVLHCCEQGTGKGHLFRSMHLGPHHIDGAGTAVTLILRPLQVMQTGQAGNGDVQNVLRDFAALSVQHGVGRQMQTHIAL